jgi:outer membrane receptor protein involved in Fe transport
LAALLTASVAFGQSAAPAPAAPPPADPDQPIVLSPFTVDASQDRGYFAQNTLAGSRMNTNISDLGASISVITKQEMLDTASVDLNDVFRYQINTEGSSTYTPTGSGYLTLRSDGVLDVNGGASTGSSVTPFTNASANRVRGLGVPSIAINYYPAIGQLPLDAYNIQSVEISRGPNSMLFGLGSPAGIVNQTTAQAVLDRTSGGVSARTDQNGSVRGTFNFNQPLIDGKLALYVAAVYDDRKFEREPSYDKTRRAYAALTFKPFSKTTHSANIEGYENNNRRPNTLTPRDFVTQWNLAGRPVYDPTTRTISKINGGDTLGVYVINANSSYANDVRNFIASRPGYDPALWNAAQTAYNGVNVFGDAALTTAGTFSAGSNTPSNNALFVPGITWTNQARTTMQIANGQLQNWFQPLRGQRYRTGWGTPGNPAANAPLYPDPESSIWLNPTWDAMYNRGFTASTGWTAIGNNIIGYKYPGVTDKSIYDYENINVNEMNFGEDKNTNYNVELEQEILPSLYLNAGWFRQDFISKTNYTVAQLNVATLFVDTNKTLPDGSANPFFGKPYVEDSDPDRYINRELDDHYRAMLAWTPDFTRNSNWTRWLGHHQILGLWSRDESQADAIRQRLEYLGAGNAAGAYRYFSNHNNNADGSPTGWNFQTTSLRRTFYLADPSDPAGVATRASGEWNPLVYTGNIRVYDYANSTFDDVSMTTAFNTFDASTVRTQREVDSISAGMTNYLWNDRLVTTFGVRRDKYRARTSTNAAILDADKNVAEPAMTNAQKWVNGFYQTETVFNRWNLWDELTGTTRTLGGVLRPFRNWNSIDNRANSGSLWWQFVRDFGVSYNQSSNFNPPPTAQGDAFGNQLPKPTGEGKDYGFQFSLFDNKLFARVTWFEATNENERTNPGTSISRLEINVDQTLFRNWARTIAMINMGMDPTANGFGQNLTPAQEDSVRAAAEPIWKQAYLYYDNLPYARGATRDAEAKGVEAEINYNPTPNWTMKFTFGKQDTKYSNVLKEFNAWYDVRYPVWQAAKAKDYLLPQYQNFATYTTSGGRQVDLTNFWSSTGFTSEVRLDEPNGNYTVQDYYNINVTPQVLLARDLEGQSAPGQRKYHWSYLTTYNFTEGRMKGFFIGGSERWESKSVIGYYGRASGANGTQLDVSDTAKPIYDPANSYTDLWLGYSRKLERNIKWTVRLNVVNVFENGGLQPVSVNYDGTPYAFRIVDPRQFILTTSFDF